MIGLSNCAVCKHQRPLKDGWMFCCDAFPEGYPPEGFPFGIVEDLEECNNGVRFELKEGEELLWFTKKKI